MTFPDYGDVEDFDLFGNKAHLERKSESYATLTLESDGEVEIFLLTAEDGKLVLKELTD